MIDEPSTDELEGILSEWQSFAQRKVFAFRGITDAAYALYSTAYFRDIANRSFVRIMREGEDVIVAIVYEPGKEAATVHWAWTHFAFRNTGRQKILWDRCGLTNANIFISHLTVVSEKLAEKYGWLYSPFSLYKGQENENYQDSIQSGPSESSE